MTQARDKANIPVLNFASKGIDDNATSTALTITSGADVQIGSTNSGVGGVIDLSVGNTSSAGGITLWSTTTAAHSIGFADGYTGTDRYRGYLEYRHNGDSMQFATSATEKMRLNSTGLGIGTSSPATPLHISGTNPTITFQETDQSNRKYVIGSFGNAYGLYDETNSQYRYIVDTNGNHIFNEGGLDCDFRVESNNNANMLFIDGGNDKVGIGTSAPAGKLDVAGTIIGDALQIDGNAVIQTASGDVSLTIAANENSSGREPALKLKGANSSSNPIIQYGDSTSYTGSIQYENADKSMQFGVNSSEKMRIDSAGRILINTTSHIGTSPYLNIANTYTNSGMAIKSNTANAHHAIEFHNTNNQVGFINTSGTSTVYSTSSDYRLKENVVEMTNATDRLKQLQPKRFNFIADEDTTVDGFIAHEVLSVVPEAISGTHNEVEVWRDGEELPDGVSIGDNKLDDNGNTIPKYQGIDQSKLVPLLVKTIQELEARITALETTTP